MSCPICKAPHIIKGITGAWFAWLDKKREENIQINYCPECGKMLDDAGAMEVCDRLNAARRPEQQPEAKP